MTSRSVKTDRKRPKGKKTLMVLGIVLVVLFVGMLAATPFMVMPMFLGQRLEQRQYLSAEYGIESERITLQTDDSLEIAAWRTRAEQPRGTVILLSGIDNPSVTAFFGYAKMLSDHGWDALLIEMRARSESGGDEIGLGMTEWLDVKAGVEYLLEDEESRGLPIVAMGTSMGAGVAIIAAGESPGIDAVISLSAFSSWSDMFVEYMSMTGIPKAVAVLEKPFVNLYLGFHFGFDALGYSPVNGISKLGERPILLMHSTEDSQVPYGQFETLLEAAARHHIDVTTFIREGDEHFICYGDYFGDPAQDLEFSKAVLDFLDKYFP